MNKNCCMLWKGFENNFLTVILKEKPAEIQLGTMNLHNFDKAIKEVYEFNQTLDTSIEQLYLNRNKLNSTINKLIEFCLHIDTEQYGFDFTGEASNNPLKHKHEKERILKELEEVKHIEVENVDAQSRVDVSPYYNLNKRS